MKNEGVPIVKEGLPFIWAALLVALACLLGKAWSGAIVSLTAAGFFAYFFRNPERVPPLGSQLVASPADGRVIAIGPVEEPEFLKTQMMRVSIFLSLWDVHVNRSPLDGTVKNTRHRAGRFMAAFEERASEENERNSLLIESTQGVSIVVVQVAGLIARRIVCYPTIGTFIMKGQRFGLIRFGSRTDLYLPLSAQIKVKIGDRVLGGESIVAELQES